MVCPCQNSNTVVYTVVKEIITACYPRPKCNLQASHRDAADNKDSWHAAVGVCSTASWSKKVYSYELPDLGACLFHQAVEQAGRVHAALYAPGLDREMDKHRNGEGKGSPALTSDVCVRLLGECIRIITAKVTGDFNTEIRWSSCQG